ncbi:MAG: lipoprotein signal peptidase [Muribaculaceae bacterium]|nr:lipoprotein signal peptidase [Muribaculaceae bacterium]MDE7155620.1 lipoprotein signal peptidase [Muribaculaceae bacterium]MDE7369757.1 lipoprotein signal peptidase [Muribaculaceae bacterium]
MKSKGLLALIIILSVILVDQIVKIYIKTHFYLGESVEVASWFKILFIENNGMAFGMELGSKIFLTLLRIVVVGLVIYYVCHIKNNPKLKTGYLISLSLIIAGAAGNIIDSMFYGIIFNDPIPPTIAEMFPEDGGYAPFLYGRVVDMLYFPLFSFNWPDWIPFIGGDLFIFFQPVFNIADAAITVGILMLILFYSSQLTELQQKPKNSEEENKVIAE